MVHRLGEERSRKLAAASVDRPAVCDSELSAATAVCIRTSLALLAILEEKKEVGKEEILRAGRPFELKVKLLLSIRGVTPLLALAFLSEVGDIRRFRSVRKLHSYLGVVPTVRSSGRRVISLG